MTHLRVKIDTHEAGSPFALDKSVAHNADHALDRIVDHQLVRPKMMSTRCKIVHLDDEPMVHKYLSKIRPSLALPKDLEVIGFLDEADAAQYVAKNSESICGYMHDLSRNWRGGFQNTVIDLFTPSSRVCVASAYLGDYASRLAHVCPNRLRFLPKPWSIDALVESLKWLVEADVPLELTSRTVRVVEPVWSEICRYLDEHPHYLHQMSPEKLEHLVARIFVSGGWEVDFTSRTRDGGYDLIAIRKAFPIQTQALIEVKRWSPLRKVGVATVRSLYGIRQNNPTSQLVLATSSYLSRDAKREFERCIPWEVDFLERDRILEWCRNFPQLSVQGTFE